MYSTPSPYPKQKFDPLPESEYKNEWPQERSFKLVKRFNDPRFGDISVLKNSANQVLLLKEKMASSKNEATEDILYLKKRAEMNHSHLMKLVGYSAVTNKELCSTTYLTKAFYEFPRTDMFKELSDRQKNGTGFSHSELAHALYQLLSGLQSIHQKGLAHGDIRPQLIGFDKQRTHFELLDRLADPTPVERCQTAHLINNKEVYLSPELYRKLKGKDKSVSFNTQKNDIFALGLTILYLGTGDNLKNIYLSDGEFERRLLQEHVMNFDLKYNDENPVLCSLLKELLRLEEDKRGDITNILRQFPTYDKYKKDEANGKLVAKKNNTTKVHAQPEQYQQTYQQEDYFTGNNEPNVESQPQYKFPVADNEDFDGENPYMVKTNQVNNAPSQNYQTNNSSQYNQYSQHNYSNSNYQPQIQTTYVRSTPQQLNYNSQYQYNQPTYAYVQSQPKYVYANPEPLPTNTTNIYFDEFGNKVIRRSYQAAPVEIRKSQEINVEARKSYQDPNVEVRRGSHVPSNPETKVIKKRYVMREDGTVVEIDPNTDMNADDIRKYFDNGYTKNAIAEYDNVDQALKSDQ